MGRNCTGHGGSRAFQGVKARSRKGPNQVRKGEFIWRSLAMATMTRKEGHSGHSHALEEEGGGRKGHRD